MRLAILMFETQALRLYSGLPFVGNLFEFSHEVGTSQGGEQQYAFAQGHPVGLIVGTAVDDDVVPVAVAEHVSDSVVLVFFHDEHLGAHRGRQGEE